MMIPGSMERIANELNDKCPCKALYPAVGRSSDGSVGRPPASYGSKVDVVVVVVAAKFLVRTVWSRCARPCRSERNTLNGESRAIYQRKQRYKTQL